MPLVLTQNDISVADIDYADVLGKVYEYPARYRKLIQPGESFVYYRGRRRAGGSSQTPSYLGCGTVGNVTDPGERLRCNIQNYQPFSRPVPFKSGDFYREPEANSRTAIGFFYQVGVRPIDQSAFDEICEVGLDHLARTKMASTNARNAGTSSTKRTSDTDEALHKLAMDLAMAEAQKEWPDAMLFRAPAGRQFSLAVRIAKGKTRHVAVRATTESTPVVRLNANDVSFSKSHAADYSLWVFYDVDLDRGTAKFVGHDGIITDEDVDLEAALHGGEMRTKKVGPIAN
jgi:hypothetical protein